MSKVITNAIVHEAGYREWFEASNEVWKHVRKLESRNDILSRDMTLLLEAFTAYSTFKESTKVSKDALTTFEGIKEKYSKD